MPPSGRSSSLLVHLAFNVAANLDLFLSVAALYAEFAAVSLRLAASQRDARHTGAPIPVAAPAMPYLR
jgi:hypothetical protein